MLGNPGPWLDLGMLNTVVCYRSLGFMGFSNYRVGDDGSVWSKQYGDWRELKGRPVSKCGNKQVVIYADNRKKKAIQISILVLSAFVGLCPSGMESSHENGESGDDRLSNLKWRTRKGIHALRVKRWGLTNKTVERQKVLDSIAESIPEKQKSGKLAYRKLVREFGDVEVWKDVLGFEGLYQVSSHGRLKSLSRTRNQQGGIYRIPERIISFCGDNYPIAGLYRNKTCRSVGLHVLILETFVGPCPHSCMETCHCDGSRNNNRLDNLRWDTHRGNQLDRAKHGTDSRGEKNTKATTNENTVKIIKRMISEKKLSRPKIAKVVGVSPNVVDNIASGKTWVWVN